MTYVTYVFVSKYCGVSELQAIKDDLGDDFYRSVGAFVNTFESCRQSVFCFQAKIALLILYMITFAASL